VTLFAKAGSRTAARLVPLVGEDFTFGRMPGPDGDRSGAILTAAVGSAIASIRADGYDVVLNSSLGPQPYTALADQPMITILHTPPTLEKVLAVITAPGWAPDPRHAYVSVSEVNSAAWREVLPEVTCVPNGIRLDRWPDPGVAEPDLAVWAARITPEKGLHLAIDAIESARQLDRVAVRTRAADFDAMIMVDRYEELLQKVSRHRIASLRCPEFSRARSSRQPSGRRRAGVPFDELEHPESVAAHDPDHLGVVEAGVQQGAGHLR
jgi:hypothetical protein